MDSIETSVTPGEVNLGPLARAGLRRATHGAPLRETTAVRTVPPGQVDLDVLPQLLGYNIRCAQLALQRDLARTMEGSDVGSGVFGLLVLAGANPGISQIQIATHLDIDKASIVALVDKLEANGWVLRRRSIEDRRKHGIFLTGEGVRQLKTLKRTMRLREQAIGELFSADEREVLIKLLQRIRP